MGLKELLLKELRIDGTKRFRKLKFEWSPLNNDQFFELDHDQDTLRLNKSYRRQLLHGLSGSSTDIPVIKCLLFLVLRDVLYTQRISSKIRERIDQANRILVCAVKHERGHD